MNYVIEANTGILFLYGIYVLVLGKENDFRKQRIALLSILSCALIFPLVKMPSALETVEMATITLPEVAIGGMRTISSSNFSWIYTSISLLIAIPVLLTAFKLYRISVKEDGRYQGPYLIIESNRDLPSWSFFNLIYIGRANELSEEDKDLIIRHEMLHGELLHSLDMLLVTLLCIVFWFNPVLWIMRRTIAKVHEFEVDSIIAKQSGAAGYSVLLAKTALSRNGFLLTHHFNQSFILKRINMINMIKNKISSWKLAGLGLAIAVYFAGAACTEAVDNKITESTNVEKLSIDSSGKVHAVVDVPPMPIDGYEAFMNELRSEIEYPEAARTAGTQGKVFVEFIVNTDGTLSDFSVKKGVSPELDAEALRVVSKLKAWTPGNQQGSIVRTQLVLPISFKLD
jgi:TonB family protein